MLLAATLLLALLLRPSISIPDPVYILQPKHPQIIALCEQMDVAVKIEYLDGKEFSECLSSVTIPDELAAMRSSMKPLTLLYRPGHYDILYDSRR